MRVRTTSSCWRCGWRGEGAGHDTTAAAWVAGGGRTGEPDEVHELVGPRRVIAQTKRSGVSGRSRTRTPVAWWAALAIAAAVPTIPISPMPFAPKALT